MFVIATLYGAAGLTPVRIRNLSSSGALIEGSALPNAGSRVRLSRGSVHAPGEVVWSADGRAGLRFGCSVCVPDWLPGTPAPNGQQRVDELVFSAKSNGRVDYEAPLSLVGVPSADVALELAVLASSLSRLCDQLADDKHVAERFPENLQIIEATAQRLDRLANAAVQAARDTR